MKVRLKAISWGQSIATAPVTPRPAMRAAASMASSPLTSIFLGSQPRSAQVPPNGRWSITTTDQPAALTRPTRMELEQALANSDTYIQGIAELFAKYKIEGEQLFFPNAGQ